MRALFGGPFCCWANGIHTLGTPDRVIPDRMAKGKLIRGRTIPGQPPCPASNKTKLHVKAFLHLPFEPSDEVEAANPAA